eukprot:CAMPEP_0179074424 /NCGR_PEP_ID=MMETSP0796-20121207/33078_1 /TAXON_ID=73915 /ORGANISM="Pyrodinium bahamense, Strain pbaha01" /LENGTH=117 /DNA_ID=CAMNT_0020771645 /DNA_START=79 /DNA_END=432 /DNA_ORIENTATION=-
MAMRSRSSAAPLAAVLALAAIALWACGAPAAFTQPPRPAAFATLGPAVLVPAAAQAAPMAAAANTPAEVMDLGSSVSLAGLTEVLMCGIVMGVVPTTILGLMVAAWLQFKKGPTLGL